MLRHMRHDGTSGLPARGGKKRENIMQAYEYAQSQQQPMETYNHYGSVRNPAQAQQRFNKLQPLNRSAAVAPGKPQLTTNQEMDRIASRVKSRKAEVQELQRAAGRVAGPGAEITAEQLPKLMEQMGHPTDPAQVDKIMRGARLRPTDTLRGDQLAKSWHHLKTTNEKAQDGMPSEVIAELNKVRANPAAYAQNLEPMKRFFKGKTYDPQDGSVPICTTEGVKAVDECIKALKSTKPMQPLTAAVGLTKAAEDHAIDTGDKGLTGHTGSDGSTPFQRMERWGQWMGAAAENCAYGGRSAAEHVQQLLIDDGVRSRGHRKNILNPQYARVGAGISTHVTYGTTCVQTFAAEYDDAPANITRTQDAARPRKSKQPRNLPSKGHAVAASKIQRNARTKLAKNKVQTLKASRSGKIQVGGRSALHGSTGRKQGTNKKVSMSQFNDGGYGFDNTEYGGTTEYGATQTLSPQFQQTQSPSAPSGYYKMQHQQQQEVAGKSGFAEATGPQAVPGTMKQMMNEGQFPQEWRDEIAKALATPATTVRINETPTSFEVKITSPQGSATMTMHKPT
eukprot:TRINITY_DN68370_c0_g1_i1.p1 TRINITY_DN68370_c0_g1~~TRINITY_DN68370_c0_g1_i1.p1  ORF type:complete len:565 (+),score=64.02 TRINITY_DN68370_c0_g1_i1:76-1770(+)